jgi:hypothetical protein
MYYYVKEGKTLLYLLGLIIFKFMEEIDSFNKIIEYLIHFIFGTVLFLLCAKYRIFLHKGVSNNTF